MPEWVLPPHLIPPIADFILKRFATDNAEMIALGKMADCKGRFC
jgi:hypothetical protein